MEKMTTPDVQWLKDKVISILEHQATQTEQIKQLCAKIEENKATPEKWANAIKIIVTAVATAAVSVASTFLAIQ